MRLVMRFKLADINSNGIVESLASYNAALKMSGISSQAFALTDFARVHLTDENKSRDFKESNPKTPDST